MKVPQRPGGVETPPVRSTRALRKKLSVHSEKGTVSVPLYLSYVLMEVRYGGYTTCWPATWFLAWERMHGRMESDLQLQDSMRAHEVLMWVRGLHSEERTPYLETAREIAELGRLDKTWAPFVASLTSAYAHIVQRKLYALAAAADEWEGKKSTYFGRVGTRDEFILTVLRIEPRSSIWGGVLVFFRDSNGNVAKWFASRVPQGLRPGFEVRVRATVKDHREHGGVQQTVLTRIQVHGPPLPTTPLRSVGDLEDGDVVAP